MNHLFVNFQNYLFHSQTEIISSINSIDIEQRLAIYHNAYRSRLLKALIKSYPALYIYLGHEQFKQLSHAYIQANPSQFHSIRWFGDKFADFLKNHPWCESMPYLVELAQLEWAMAAVFDAPDGGSLPIEKLQAISPNDCSSMCFQVNPSLQRLNLAWNIVPIWQAILDKHTADALQQYSSITTWIFWRKEYVSQFCLLTMEEAWAVNALINGLTFGDICAGLCRWFDENQVVSQAAILLQKWLTTGLIADLIIF